MLLAVASPALGEACTKIAGADWRPGDWPTATTTPSWGIVAALAVTVVGLVIARRNAAAILLGVCLVAAVQLHETQLGIVDDITLQGVREGCVRYQSGIINVLLGESALALAALVWLCREIMARLARP